MIPPLILVAISLALGAWGFYQQRKRTAMSATPALKCEEIGRTGQPITCEVKGAATPGPGGPVRAPFSGQECVWYRAKVSVRYHTHEHRNGRTETHTRTETVHDETHLGPFAIRDDTGQILLHHNQASVDHAGKSVDRYERAGRDVNLFGLSLRVNFSNVQGHQYEEWIIPAGQPMYALGAAGADGAGLHMGKPSDAPFIISTRSEEDLANRLKLLTYAGYAGGGLAFVGGLVWLAVKAIAG